ncbi:hypothetical protein B0T14DRAFT_23835 [Immersiella caudata]|uniref:Uncharacterized protein n=1 Tax=Immersiella caudata TaxID=314043 RepID=A0AA39XDZ4_9PEZI|nr:hypothetical protein B0T14DRAFT_23835 [Immersiella caudata]
MRTTAPALRRRNFALRKKHRAWLARRDDDGDASGEDSGDEDEALLIRPVARPPSNTGQRASAGAVPVAAGGSATGASGVRLLPAVSGGNARVVNSGAGTTLVPISTVAAEGEELTSASDTDGIESGDESESGDEEGPEAVPPPGSPPSAVVPPALAPPDAPAGTQPPPALAPVQTTTAGVPVGGATTLTTSTTQATPTTGGLPPPPPPVLAPVQTTTPGAALPVVTGTTTAAGFQTLVPPGGSPSATTPSDPSTLPIDQTIGQTPLPSLDPPPPAADVTPPPSRQEETTPAPDNAIGAVSADQRSMNPGAAAGIVVGVLGKLYLHVEPLGPRG